MNRYSVTMSNDLIRKFVPADESNGAIMPVWENRIRLMLISSIDYNAQDFEWKEITISEFKSFWGLSTWGGVQQKMLSDAIDNLKINKYCIDGHTIQWLDNDSDIVIGRMKLKLDDSLIPYLLGLKRNFTKYDVENVVNLTSKYSFRIYEILKSVENMGGYRITLPKAFEIFSDNLYNTKSELEHHILISAIDEINTKTDINISYEFRKSFGENEMLYLTVRNYDEYINNENKSITYFTVLGGSEKQYKPPIKADKLKPQQENNIIAEKSVVDPENFYPISFAPISEEFDFDEF